MYSKGFEILQQTSYSEQAQKQIWSQIQAIQNLPDLINVNFKIIKISGQLYLQMKGELINIGPQSIMFDLYFQIQYKMVQDMMQLSLVLLIIVYYLNINLKAQLGFIDFTSFLETSDKLNDVLLKIKQKFKNQYPYTKVDQDLQNIVEQFANKFKISWNDLNSINQILIVELIEGLKKKAYTNHLILDAAVMLKELQQEKNKLIKFKNENQDKNVDESNIEQIISITMPHLQQLLELNANIKGIRDTLRFLQHNFSKGRSGYIELVLFTKNLAEEEFEAQLLFIKCINQLQ